MEKYGDQVKSIEFIQHPIQRAKHKAVPIEDLKPGSYCILAVDALFELFNEIIWGSRVFEKHKVPKIIEYVLKIPTLLFKSELVCSYYCYTEFNGNHFFLFTEIPTFHKNCPSS